MLARTTVWAGLAVLVVLGVVVTGGCKPVETATPGTVVATSAEPRGPMLTCPVTGSRVHHVDMIPVKLQGQTCYVCCEECVGKLKRYPAKYADGVRRQAQELKQSADAASGGEKTGVCPMCGAEALANDMTAFTVQGKTHYACCGDCVAEIKRNPGKYLKGLKPATKPKAGPSTAPPTGS